MALKKLLKRAVTKAAGKVAAKKAVAKTTAAAKKAALVAKSKKVAAAKKAGTLQKPSTRKRPQLSEAAKERQRVSAGQRKPVTKAKSTIKVAPTKRTSTVKSKVTLSKTLERRRNRRSSSGKSPATGDKAKIAKIREAQKDKVSTSKRSGLSKAQEAKRRKQAFHAPSTKGVPKKNQPAKLTKEDAAAKKGGYTYRVDPDGSRVRVTNTKVSQKTKRADSRKTLKTTESKGKSLPKSEKVRLAKSALRDRGAQHVVKNTPKSSTATAKAAGKPRKSQKNYSAGSRGPIYGPRTPKPKATNASQVDTGRVERNAQTEGRKAVAKYNVEARLTKMKAATSNARMPNLSSVERQKLRRQKTKEINAKAQRVRELSERKSVRKQSANKNNVSTSAAKQNQLELGNRDWRNRMTDSKTRKLSESATRASSPGTPKKAPFRRKDDPKPKSPKQSSTSVSRAGPGPKQATKAPKSAGGSNKTRITRDQDGQTVVSRPTASQRRTGVEYKPQRADLRGSNTKRGMDELPIGKKSTKVQSSSKTSASPSSKQSAGYKAREAREKKATKALKARNQAKPTTRNSRMTARENSARIRKSLRETRNMSADSRMKAQRAQNQSVPREPDNRSKAQRDAARKLAPKTYEDYGKGTTTWSN